MTFVIYAYFLSHVIFGLNYVHYVPGLPLPPIYGRPGNDASVTGTCKAMQTLRYLMSQWFIQEGGGGGGGGGVGISPQISR